MTKPGQNNNIDRHKYNSHSSNDFDPDDFLTPRGRRGSPTTPRRGVGEERRGSDVLGRRRRGGGDEEGEGEMSGAVSLPIDEIGGS